MSFYGETEMCVKYKVYDRVWVMQNNAPTELLVYSITHEMNFGKNGVQTFYSLVHSTVGAGAANDCGTRFDSVDIYLTKDELLNGFT